MSSHNRTWPALDVAGLPPSDAPDAHDAVQGDLLEQLAKALPKEKFEPRSHGEEHDERNLFDRVKDMFG